MRWLDRVRPAALLVLRVVAGIILIVHGKMKVFGGLHQHMQMVASIGLPAWMGLLSTATEFFGGMLLIAGLLTRLIGLAVACEMAVAVSRVHWKHGITGQGGYEFPLLLGTVGLYLVFAGAGPISLDRLLTRRKTSKP